MEATKKVVSQIETILCQKMAEATGKPAHEFSLSVEEREKMKEAVDDMVNEYFTDQEKQGKIKSELDLVNKILDDWFEEDKEHRSALTMIIDTNEENISGCILGRHGTLISGLSCLMKREEKMKDIVMDASSCFMISDLKDSIKKLISDNDEDHGNAEQQQQ